MLGSYLVRFFGQLKQYTVYGCDTKTPPQSDRFFQADLLDASAIRRIIQKIQPTIIIHCAALIDVDFCEDNRELAKKVNVDTSLFLAEISQEMDIKFIFISSDAVFSGQENVPYTEKSFTNPVNYYGETKVLAEKAILSTNARSIILRTNIYGWLNDPDRKTFAEWVYFSLRSGNPITMFTDVIYSPIYIGNLACIIQECLLKNITGLYHCGGGEHCSKYAFACKLAEAFILDSTIISKGSYFDFDYRAPRSGYMALDSSLLMKELDSEILNVTGGLEMFRRECNDNAV